MNSDKKTILVTGGCGFIGTNIALEAVSRGHNVIAFDNLSRAGSENNISVLEKLGVTVVRGDVTRLETIPDMPFNAIIHLAANTGIGVSLKSPYYDFTQNAVGTINMLDIARALDIPFIYASTNKVYSEEVNNVPLYEDYTRYKWDIEGINEGFRVDGSHHTPYGASKLAGDLYCQEYYQSFGVKTVVNRMSCIYGEYQHGVEEQGWVDHFIRSVLNNQKINIYGDGKQVRDILWGRDVARLYITELENIYLCKGNVFNVGGGKLNTTSLLECFEEIKTQTGLEPNVELHDWRDADQKIYISDISKVVKTLNWTPRVSPWQGIKTLLDSYKCTG